MQQGSCQSQVNTCRMLERSKRAGSPSVRPECPSRPLHPPQPSLQTTCWRVNRKINGLMCPEMELEVGDFIARFKAGSKVAFPQVYCQRHFSSHCLLGFMIQYWKRTPKFYSGRLERVLILSAKNAKDMKISRQNWKQGLEWKWRDLIHNLKVIDSGTIHKSQRWTHLRVQLMNGRTKWAKRS